MILDTREHFVIIPIRSFKVGCPVKLHVRLNRPKGEDDFLKVTKLAMVHQNHHVSREVFILYQERRRIVHDEIAQSCPLSL